MPRREASADLQLQGLSKSFGALRVIDDVSLVVPAGTMVALIGPSGCGKTTTLRMVAGLEQPDRGRIVVGGVVITDGARGVPPESRAMGMVFQSYALWPHMTVAENVAYGLKRKRLERPMIREKVRDVLQLVGMAPYAERYPGQLSGGQQQRAALARAIAVEPRTLLFDEPLSNLDAVLREQMRFELRSLQQKLGITGVYVTHSQDEALVLSDQVAVMCAGQVVQVGSPDEVYDTPHTEFVARFIGLANILPLADCVAHAGGVCGRMAGGVPVMARGTSVRDHMRVMVRPENIRLRNAAEGTTSADGINRLHGVVESATSTGNLTDTIVRLDAPGSSIPPSIRVQALPPLQHRPDDRVVLEFDASRTVALNEPDRGSPT